MSAFRGKADISGGRLYELLEGYRGERDARINAEDRKQLSKDILAFFRTMGVAESYP